MRTYVFISLGETMDKDRLNDLDEKIGEFFDANQEFLNNKIIKNFLNNIENQELLLNVIENPNENNKNKIDESFKKFYFNVRFISFISQTIYFSAINFDKKIRLVNSRFPLIADSNLKEDDQLSIKDLIVDDKAHIDIEQIINDENLEKYVGDEKLLQAILLLTETQKKIISLSYIDGLSDTEIARKLNKSQQTVSKTRKKALENIHSHLNLVERRTLE